MSPRPWAIGERVRAVVRRRAVAAVWGPELERLVRGAAHASRIADPIYFGGDPSKVHIGEDAVVNDALFNVSSGTIRIEERAFFGHGVSLLTGTHDVSKLGLERQAAIPSDGRDILIEEGAWVASGATVLGPARIGSHAVIAAGAVVTGFVPAFTIMAGVPARPVGRVEVA